MIPATTSILSSRSPFRAPRFTVDQTYLTTNYTRIATTNDAVWAGNVMYFSDGTTLLSMDM